VHIGSGEPGDQVGSNAHDDEGRDPVQSIVREEQRAVELVRALVRRSNRRTVVGGRRGGVVSNHGDVVDGSAAVVVDSSVWRYWDNGGGWEVQKARCLLSCASGKSCCGTEEGCGRGRESGFI
jgi:hypothetical protein